MEIVSKKIGMDKLVHQMADSDSSNGAFWSCCNT